MTAVYPRFEGRLNAHSPGKSRFSERTLRSFVDTRTLRLHGLRSGQGHYKTRNQAFFLTFFVVNNLVKSCT